MVYYKKYNLFLGDSEFQIIQKKERRTEHSSHQMHAEHLEDNQSDGNVDLGPESSDLAGIDELGTYSDTNNVLIPKYVNFLIHSKMYLFRTCIIFPNLLDLCIL